MAHTTRWTVDIFISEDEGGTRAEAWLHTGSATHLSATGDARLNPHDADVPEIGAELAVARALAALSNRLLHTAADDIEAVTHEPVHLER
ncbi:MAG: dsRBD fold-containing protein [Jiangellaceae bacterium]